MVFAGSGAVVVEDEVLMLGTSWERKEDGLRKIRGTAETLHEVEGMMFSCLERNPFEGRVGRV